jgi:dolichol-phosphate mannosyltransferase
MISVILPTRNEPLINDLIAEVHKALKGRAHEIIVVDLSDKKPVIKGAKLYLQKSKGLGNAVLEGIGYAKGDIIVVMDSDFAHDPKDIPRLLEKTDKYDIVIGSRYAKGAKSMDTLFRKTASRIYCFMSNIVLGLPYKDTMNGFAVVRRKVYDSIKLNPLGYKIHTETFYKARKKGFLICEVPITFHKRRAGKSNTNFREAVRTLFFIFQLRFKPR